MHTSTSASFAVLMTAALIGAVGCSKPEPAAHPQPAEPQQPSTEAAGSEELGQPSDPRFIGKIWMSTTLGHPRGTLMIFLPDRSLLMDSCFETYRISKWGAEGDRIRWIEDAIPIEGTISMPSDHELNLQIAGQDKVQSFVSAAVPFVCPDMPR